DDAADTVRVPIELEVTVDGVVVVGIVCPEDNTYDPGVGSDGEIDGAWTSRALHRDHVTRVERCVFGDRVPDGRCAAAEAMHVAKACHLVVSPWVYVVRAFT